MTTRTNIARSVRISQRRDRGFTAIEISMVATVVAILALIVMPIFRNRVEEAKLAAAKADLTSLMKAELLAQADTGFYFRLEDLDNTENNNNGGVPPANGVILETPPFVYFPRDSHLNRRGLTVAEWVNLAGPSTLPKFRGPYITSQNTVTYGELQTSPIAPAIMQSLNADPASPIWDLPNGSNPVFDHLENRIPVDPWGNPYLFFPSASETNYTNSVIYSLGPNGLPGNSSGAAITDWRRHPTTPLGSGDDLQVQF